MKEIVFGNWIRLAVTCCLLAIIRCILWHIMSYHATVPRTQCACNKAIPAKKNAKLFR